MNPESVNSCNAIDISRCQHLSPAGRHCRMPATSESFPFCIQHAASPLQDLDSVNLAPALLGKLRKISAATDMQRILGKIFILLAEGRITTKRASVLTYIMQQLLRTLPAIDHELGIKEKPEPPRIEFSYFPRPLLERFNAAQAAGDASGESVDPGKKSS